MNKILSFLWMLLILTASLSAQQPKSGTPPPRPAAPKGPSPYVLKKDYEAQMSEMNAKVNAASNAAAGVRNSMQGKFEKVTELDSQMQQVQEVLNSASFQIAITSDSLKETRVSMDEFQKQTEAGLEKLRAGDEDLKSSIMTMFGVAIAVAVLIAGIVFFILHSKTKQANALVHQETDIVKKNAAEKLEKAKTELKDEMQSVKSRLQVDLNALKMELNGNLQKDKEAISAQIQSIIDKLNPPEEAQGVSDNETII
jgi:hypothetical protein